MSQYAPDEQVMVSPQDMAGAGNPWHRVATDSTRELADSLDDIRLAFRSQPTAPVSRDQHARPAPGPRAVAPVTPTPPAGHHR
ncbi:hypothetical protein [Streptomyces sp. SYSU K217416]